MADPHRRYAAPPGLGGVVKSSFPGYLSSEPPSFLSNHSFTSTDLRSYSSDLLRRDMRSTALGGYGVDSVRVSVSAEPAVAVTAGTGYSSALVQNLLSQRREAEARIGSSVSTEIRRETSAPLRSGDGLPVIKGESNILFVDGLPTDCTRREVGHLFRSFIGFQEIKVVHKEPRRSGDKAMVLCFVEFLDPKCALTAMEALQGHKFDDKNPDSLPLKIQFAHFPFRLPSDLDQKRSGSRH